MRIALLRGFVSGLLLVGAVGAVPAGAQDACGPAGGDLAERVPPPAASDRVFVIDEGPGLEPALDPNCTFRSGGPLVINLPVTRYLGPTTASGSLGCRWELVEKKLVSRYATLTMAAWDVDYYCSASPPKQCERDRVYFNGERVDRLHSENNQYLMGVNAQWAANTFKIPIEKVKFPTERGANGNAPTPAMNEIRIEIDVANTTEEWCTAIDWVALEIQCMSPIILIHGNGSDGQFFSRRGFVWWEGAHLHQGRFDYSINMPSDTRARNAVRLNAAIPLIVRSFGADSVRLVAHSKGGLDAREYLEVHQPANQGQFQVLSLTTLSTPHDGSVLADLVVKRSLVATADAIKFPGFPLWTAKLLEHTLLNPGYRDLQTKQCADFNGTNVAALHSAGGTAYCTVAADADQDGTQSINLVTEYMDMCCESPALAGYDVVPYPGKVSVSNLITDRMYQILRNTSAVKFTWEVDPQTAALISRLSAVTGGPFPNDIMVTVPSALGAGGYGTLVAPPYSATYCRFLCAGPARNHASVADGVVGAAVVKWLVQIERDSGDLVGLLQWPP